MEKDDKGSTMIRMGVSGWMFLLVPAYPGCPGSKAVKRSLYRAPKRWLVAFSLRISDLHLLIDKQQISQEHRSASEACTRAEQTAELQDSNDENKSAHVGFQHNSIFANCSFSGFDFKPKST